jgi:RNA polymerase sigma-70 factor (ECF subfamily)
MYATAMTTHPALQLRRPSVTVSALAAERDNDHRDEWIASSLQRGDTAAVETLYERFGRTVFAFLVNRIGDRAVAEDVHQQVFTELWRRGTEYDPERAGLFTWVMTIARSRAIDHLRRAVPEPHEPERAAALAEARGESESTEDLVERWRVAQLLQRIPADEAGMLRLRFYEGLSQREIAERTATPLGTVKMRMIQALERLRVLIEEEDG